MERRPYTGSLVTCALLAEATVLSIGENTIHLPQRTYRLLNLVGIGHGSINYFDAVLGAISLEIINNRHEWSAAM